MPGRPASEECNVRSHLHRFVSTGLLATALLAVGCGGGTETASESGGAEWEGPGGDFSPVIARVGDLEITQAYFDFRYDNLSPGEKARFSGEDWQTRFLDALVGEMLVSIEAETENLHRERETRWKLDELRREQLFRAYYQKHFQDQLQVPEAALREHYENFQDNYRMMGRVLVHHIQNANQEEIQEAWEELQEGANFTRMAAKYSEDEQTKDDHGTLGWVNPDGYVLGRGFDEEFTDIVFDLPAETTNPPVRIGENWHIIKTGPRYDGQVQTFDEVRDRIERELKPRFQQQAYENTLAELETRYGVQRFGEFDREENRTAEELYRLAGESMNKHAKLEYYRSLIDNHPEHERADDALFMAGFVASEELFSAGEAAVFFRRLLNDYPESEFVEDAQYMLGNLGGVQSALREGGMPKSAEEAVDRIETLR